MTEVKLLLWRGKAAKDYRLVYWLEAVVQGGIDTSFSRYAIFEEGLVTCSCCGDVVGGSIWEHLSYFLRVILEDPELIDEQVIIRGQADLRAGLHSSLWLRGLRPLDMVEPLTSEYMFTNS